MKGLVSRNAIITRNFQKLIVVLSFFCSSFLNCKNLKSLQFSSGSNLVFDGLSSDFFEVQFSFFVKRETNYTIKQRKLKGHEKYDRLVVSQMDEV